MSYEQLKLENQICFPLYAASKMIIRLYKPFLDPLELTYTQYITLLALWEKDGISVKTLGDVLFLDSGTLTPLIKKLEKRGVIRKERDIEDERAVRVFVTDLGWQLMEEVKDIPERMTSCVQLPMNDLIALHRILNNLIK